MVDLLLGLQATRYNLLRVDLHDYDRVIYVPIVPLHHHAPGECLWSDGVTSLFLVARAGPKGGGLVIELRVVVDGYGEAAAARAA